MSSEFSFTDQVNLLFEQRLNADGKPYSLQEIADATGISVPTLSQMRHGQNTNPRLHTLRMLADFFDVSLGYFEGTSREDCLSRLYSDPETRPPVTDLALRAANLSPEAQRDLMKIITWLVAAERNRGDKSVLMTEFEPYEDD